MNQKPNRKILLGLSQIFEQAGKSNSNEDMFDLMYLFKEIGIWDSFVNFLKCNTN